MNPQAFVNNITVSVNHNKMEVVVDGHSDITFMGIFRHILALKWSKMVDLRSTMDGYLSVF